MNDGKRLKEFLKREKVWDKFVDNLVNEGEMTVEDFFSAEPIGINYAFKWKETPEGFNFWLGLHQKFIEESYNVYCEMLYSGTSDEVLY